MSPENYRIVIQHRGEKQYRQLHIDKETPLKERIEITADHFKVPGEKIIEILDKERVAILEGQEVALSREERELHQGRRLDLYLEKKLKRLGISESHARNLVYGVISVMGDQREKAGKERFDLEETLWKRISKPEEEEEAKVWKRDLAEFIVEANQNTWAAKAEKVESEREGYKELEYQKGNWRLRDSYTGYFRAPGMTTVYYKNKPVWTMAYGGEGITEGNEALAKRAFKFLRKALMQVTSEQPYRGSDYEEDGWRYQFKLKRGDISDFSWEEKIYSGRNLVFKQEGMGGLVIDKDESGEPILPWNL